ncbi:MAG: 30S ribosomal protein S21 [Nitrospinota bacterium]
MADPLTVKVDENLERAIKSLKKKMDKEGIFKELRKRRSYEKPSVRRRAKRARAIRAQRRNAAART